VLLALGASVSAVHADESNVALYGILDSAIANIQHALDFSASHPVANNPNVTKGTNSATGVLNGGMSATRWGMKGQEDLGGGTNAVFLLEQGFNLASGAVSNAALSLANNKSTGPDMSADSAVSGQLFNRGAYVGLASGSLGTLTFGRQQSFFLDNIAVFDPMMGSQAFSPIGFSGTYGGGGATEDSRVDNSLKYKLALGDFALGALYKFGGVAGNATAQTGVQLNGVYSAGPLAVQLGYQALKDAFASANASGAGTLAATAEDTKAFMIAAKYTYEQLTVRTGYEREDLSNPSHPAADQGVTYLFGIPLSAPASVNAYPNQEVFNVYWLGGGYAFTPALNLLIGGYRVTQNDYDPVNCANRTQSARCSGTLNYYSLVGDFGLSKRTDFYAGFMESTVSGGPASKVANTPPLPSETSNRIIALGMRHRF